MIFNADPLLLLYNRFTKVSHSSNGYIDVHVGDKSFVDNVRHQHRCSHSDSSSTHNMQSYFIFLPISSTKSITLGIILIFMVFRNRMRLGQDGRNLSEWIRPWFCGLGSGVMDISITFPINKVMFRQQLNGITSKQAINQLKGNFLPVTQICDPPIPKKIKRLFLDEMTNMKSLSRIKYMYRGLLPPTFNRCLGRMFTFGGYDSCRRLLSQNSQFKGQTLNFLAALGSGAFEGKSHIVCARA